MLWKITLSDINNNGQNAFEITRTLNEVESYHEAPAIMYANPQTMRLLLGTTILKAAALGGALFSQYMGCPIKEDRALNDNEIIVISYSFDEFKEMVVR